MKNVIFPLCFAISMLLLACSKDEAFPVEQNLIVGQWKLIGLENLSDQHKYLNTTLEINSDESYTNSEAEGEVFISGSWDQLSVDNKIYLSSGIFEDYSVDYSIEKIDSASLVLKRHYTLGGKDTFLKYSYAKMP